MKPVIFGLSGPELTGDERALFRSADPAGYILFRRNIDNRAQVRALTDDLRSLSGRDNLPILVDQEGGRVARMRPPEWPAFPPLGLPFGSAYVSAPMTAIEAARANAEALALLLSEIGITVNCAPLLDLHNEGGDAVIGDRSFGADPFMVAALGRAVLDGLAAGGVVGVVKHIPGHGRATVDSHHELPVVTATAEQLEADIAPFARLSDAPMAMTAHVVYTSWDADLPATLSPTVIGDVIRGRVGFDGLLMCDDIDMKALSGKAGEKAAGAIAAGCDVALHCSGILADMAEIAESLPEIAPVARARLDRAMAIEPRDFPVERAQMLMAKRDNLLDILA